MARLLPMVLVASLSVACRSAPTPPPAAAPEPAALEVELVASPRLNPDDQGRSLPTAVRIYQLKSAARLEGADYDRIYRQPKETLGDELLQADELTLSPGQAARRRVERDRAARVLVVVAVFRRPTASSWRAMADLALAQGATTFTFVLDGYRVDRR